MTAPRRACVAAACAALVAAPAAGETGIPKVEAVLDLAAQDGLPAQARALAAALADAPVLYLDLTIRPAPGDDAGADTADWGVSAVREGRSGRFACEGWGALDGPLALAFAPLPGDNHTLLEIAAGEGPFGVVACEYDPAAARLDLAVLRIRGFFAVSGTAIPTAVAYRLRPLAVDARTAAETLRPEP